MPYVAFDIPSPDQYAEPIELETLEDAHNYCMESKYGTWIILEGTSLSTLEKDMGTPIAIYHKGVRFDLVKHNEGIE